VWRSFSFSSVLKPLAAGMLLAEIFRETRQNIKLQAREEEINRMDRMKNI
jgi:hypothetical protein